MNDQSRSAKITKVLLWIIIPCLVVSLLVSVGILIWLSMRKPGTATATTAVTAPPRTSRTANGFADLSESDVPGRYRMTDKGKVTYMVLNDDHTFINTDGTTYPPYRWEVLPDRFIITWQRSSSTFTRFEAPGVYSTTRSDGTISRIEKLPDIPPADTIVVSDKDVVASILLSTTIQTNSLALANIEDDGEIFPGEAGGQDCHQLIRKRGKFSAFLYARMASELKTEPFTNALVTVEYFDSPARDPRNGWLSLQYDGRDGPYTSTGQRVKLGGTMKWTRATFVLDAPLFTGRESDEADFRLCAANSDLSVRAIKVAKNRAVH